MSDEYADVIERLKDEGGFEDEIAVLEKFSKGRLREAAGRATELERERDEWKAKAEKAEAAPKRREAFQKYGIDLENLSKLERKALEGYEGELTDEAIAEFVEENELPVLESDGSDEKGEENEAEKIAGAARRAGANGSRVPKVTPAEVAEWPADRWVRFAEANPDAAEALRQGKEVTGVTG